MAKKRVWEADQFVYQSPVLDKDLTSPPSAPTKGDRYLVIGADSGSDWAGYEDYITEYDGVDWTFIAPKAGMLVYVKDEEEYYGYITEWTKLKKFLSKTKTGLMELDRNEAFMPIEEVPSDFEKDGLGDLMPGTDFEVEDDEFELDNNGDIIPKE